MQDRILPAEQRARPALYSLQTANILVCVLLLVAASMLGHPEKYCFSNLCQNRGECISVGLDQ